MRKRGGNGWNTRPLQEEHHQIPLSILLQRVVHSFGAWPQAQHLPFQCQGPPPFPPADQGV